MISQDEVRIQGNLARDPQVLPSSGKARTRIVVAVQYGYGESKKTQYRDVMVFGVTAENCAKFLSKGAAVLVEGHLNTNVYTPEGGETQYTLEIIGDRVQFGYNPNAQTQDAPAEELAAA